MERAAIVGFRLKRENPAATAASLDELGRLLETAGVEAAVTLNQERDARDPATLVGRGKVEEIAEAVRAGDLHTVVFNEELTPTQQRNLEEKIGAKIIDRTRLILDIFAQRARTREGKLQVELAQMNYLLPRVTEKFGRFEQQVGGIGTRGPGERKLEISQRRIREQIVRLERAMESVQAQRAVQRENRSRLPHPVVALVGYTNAGKSTLLNVLHGAGEDAVYADDKLFATLDPTTRRVRLPGGRMALFTDTVGFIQDLPHHLVAAFRATLEEAADADLLLHVIDASSPQAAHQRDVVNDVLTELGVGHRPCLDVYNKADALGDAPRAAQERRGHRLVSAKRGDGLAQLLSDVESRLEGTLQERSFLLPHDRRDLLPLLHEAGRILEERPRDDGVWMRVRLDEKNWNRLRRAVGPSLIVEEVPHP